MRKVVGNGELVVFSFWGNGVKNWLQSVWSKVGKISVWFMGLGIIHSFLPAVRTVFPAFYLQVLHARESTPPLVFGGFAQNPQALLLPSQSYFLKTYSINDLVNGGHDERSGCL